MSVFNEEQAQAGALEVLKDLQHTVEMAINITETGPLFPCDKRYPVELEPQGLIIGDWYCTRIKKR